MYRLLHKPGAKEALDERRRLSMAYDVVSPSTLSNVDFLKPVLNCKRYCGRFNTVVIVFIHDLIGDINELDNPKVEPKFWNL